MELGDVLAKYGFRQELELLNVHFDFCLPYTSVLQYGPNQNDILPAD